MAQRNGKGTRVTIDTQKKVYTCKDQLKRAHLLRVLVPFRQNVKRKRSSCLRQVKDTPKPTKPAPTLKGGKTVTVKALPPTSPSKPSARGVTAKLATPVKTPPARPTTPATARIQPPEESRGPDTSTLETTDVNNATSKAESSQSANADARGLLHAEEGPPTDQIEPSADAVAATEAAAAAEEAERMRKLNGAGMVKLIYESYDELFPIEDGSTTQANIDDVYCLSFVMPNCLVRLSKHPNPERFQREEAGIFDSLVREDPRGTYHDLVKDETYFVVVEQEADQLRRDQEATKALWDGELQMQKKADKDDGRGFESCSCIYGNPCVDEYGCLDWHSRFAVATKNGWKGF
ncbi:unnamed protein product [Phytophthora fragariaefolia]|uniref:Unnamed protein product n=1 Tax=Phytophthora fragariaefolia TaxID=1490495 RepID=A0A9W6X3U0_9STRA|nr:unnamed protein product [Phytophthora fragariaefolia]